MMKGRLIMDNLQDNQGLLIVNVSLAGRVYPIEDALVTVYQKNEGTFEIISVSTTDASGRSEPVLINTPDKSLSLAPNPLEIPYSKVTVDVEKDGFYKAQFIDAPVFSGVVSIQNVELIPHPKFYFNDFYNDTVYRESEAQGLE